jgi:hypothetical protein
MSEDEKDAERRCLDELAAIRAVGGEAAVEAECRWWAAFFDRAGADTPAVIEAPR